ncbi:unnamed protein product [Blepharisma stoltei]|uniref:RBR-type E3 ubiquitin transferase n=1 Tax=Blepharisma stoltei TaxID=1481888 RepID=A0AAU9JQI5_9CILI|nr:unnamed protein product [Blepharisma stoltei]
MDDSLNDFIEELDFVNNYSSALTFEDFYIAGIVRLRTHEKLEKIFNYLLTLKQAEKEGKLKGHKKAYALFRIYQGNFDAIEQLTFIKAQPIEDEISEILTSELIRSDKTDEEDPLKNSVNFDISVENSVTFEDLSNSNLKDSNIENLLKRKHDEENRKKSEMLAYELQKKFDQEYEDVKFKAENHIKCIICNDSINNEEFRSLEKCNHFGHKLCLDEFFDHQTNKKKFPIICPYPNCKEEISINDLRSHLSEEQVKAFEEYSFYKYMESSADGLSVCPNSECNYVFQWNQNYTKFSCPKCKKTYCLACKEDYHHNKTCEMLRNGNKAKIKVQNLQFKQCPICKVWVEKTLDSNELKCNACTSVFCFKCGSVIDMCICKNGVFLYY